LFTLRAVKATVLPIHINLLQIHAPILSQLIHAIIIRAAQKTATPLYTEESSAELLKPTLLALCAGRGTIEAIGRDVASIVRSPFEMALIGLLGNGL